MAKGQQRSNREHKKPKQPKPLPQPGSPFQAVGGKAGGLGKKK
jgi:hypothetical protein